MSADQLKSEIKKTLDRIPENALQDILNYLKALEDKSGDDVELVKHFKQILEEDRNLLQRLAQ